MGGENTYHKCTASIALTKYYEALTIMPSWYKVPHERTMGNQQPISREASGIGMVDPK
jgi:hypothetical protein